MTFAHQSELPGTLSRGLEFALAARLRRGIAKSLTDETDSKVEEAERPSPMFDRVECFCDLASLES